MATVKWSVVLKERLPILDVILFESAVHVREKNEEVVMGGDMMW